MKRCTLLLFAVAVTTAAMAQTKLADAVKFASVEINLGQVKQNEPVTGTFTVTNISSKPLVIEQATPGCGCTIADYTKEPIAPGKTGFIKATYNAASIGSFVKTVTVKFLGVDETQAITLTGEVTGPAKE